MRIYLARHGQTTSNVAGIIDTVPPGPHLTDAGREQASELARRMAIVPIRLVVASTMTRALETARVVAEPRGLAVLQSPGLREISGGDLDGASGTAAFARYLDTARAWGRGQTDLRMPGGERGDVFLARFDAVMETLRVSAVEDVLVVSHGAAVHAWVAARVTPEDRRTVEEQALDNAGWAVLEPRDERRWALLEWHGARTPPRPVDPAGEPLDADRPQGRR
ncbi:histidine phosphatase family protein [Curtobacterium sp. MCBD17_034]|uniref:histidine phosphatase family protein n=1 Tax=unclassified Curtobacterium TaxID=257496 RepID=UPI000DA94F3B|nr:MULTISPECIES: histidine phosphatase family protein [unclassified Curtobacterium]PZF62119.1 histidine phosphatase family protein [Curtobacterium sp. MCBD17_034]PZM33946.1 histidine phosphatase family protein [Curtobacterium sp. MCBD17_031]